MQSDVAGALVCVKPGNGPGSLEAEFRFDPALPVFRGHFPGKPLVPGVFEIEMVRLAVERHTSRRQRIARVESAKFTGELAPGELVIVQAALAENGQAVLVNATLTVRDTVRARLSMILEAAEKEPEGKDQARNPQKGGERPGEP